MTETVKDKQLAKQRLKPPNKYAVIFLNDDFTPMDFVVELLMKIFNHPSDIANAITMEVHEKGQAVAGIYSKDIAETKMAQVLQAASENEHPLRATLKEINM